MEDLDITMKIICVGNGSVGKTSLITRFSRGIFTHEYKKTLGVDFLERRFFVDGEEVTAFLYDTAGQEEYDAVTRNYYRGASAGIIAFSTTDRASFEAVTSWHRKIVDEVGNGLPLVLVQNKIDQLAHAVVTAQEVEALAASLGVRLYRTCVKDGLNVAEIFNYLAIDYLKKRRGGGVDTQLVAFGEVDSVTGALAAGSGSTVTLGAAGAPVVKRGAKKKVGIFTSC
jgi:Ras-related protein Rab-23